MVKELGEFSFRTRAKALKRFESEVFDLLVVGGGITGACVARDAASRGLSVALVEKRDFSSGTSSRSSKLVHGGLRYLENLEFGLVFEALAERSLLMKTVPHMVRPLRFYFPVFEGDAHGKFTLGLGMWLYDLLSLFRAPGFHRNLSAHKMLAEIPFMRPAGLKGGFQYYDASMWDDVLTVQVLRSAQAMGAAIASYVEAVRPIFGETSTSASKRIEGFHLCDSEAVGDQQKLQVRAKQTVICAGPWTDFLGQSLGSDWRPWLMPSKGVHLVFDHSRIPVPGAVVMSHPKDGRISFVIPRTDYGNGVTIVGTTDGPSPLDPDTAEVSSSDVQYLMDLLNSYFPDLKLGAQDLISAYVGVRPLMAPAASDGNGSLQKVSREHHIGEGPGGVVLVAGGKYTTARKMGREIVDFALKSWRHAHSRGASAHPVPAHGPSKTQDPVNPYATPVVMAEAKARLKTAEAALLVERYGSEAGEILHGIPRASIASPEGFPELSSQLRHTIRTEMVMHLDDFYLRRVPLEMARADHGMPWAEELARVWAEELGLSSDEASRELDRLRAEIARRDHWKKSVPTQKN